MAFATLSCPACGAKEVVRRDGRYACAFCKATGLPRLLPGTLCDDGRGAHCGGDADENAFGQELLERPAVLRRLGAGSLRRQESSEPRS